MYNDNIQTYRLAIINGVVEEFTLEYYPNMKSVHNLLKVVVGDGEVLATGTRVGEQHFHLKRNSESGLIDLCGLTLSNGVLELSEGYSEKKFRLENISSQKVSRV
jgi:hypothetical protein